MSTTSLPSPPSPSSPAVARALQAGLVRMALLIGCTALLGSFASCRFKHAGQWLPSLPDTVGVWQSVETPVDDRTLSTLGWPKATARIYRSPWGEQVMASIVAAGPFENYHDPTVCVTGNGFNLTGKKTFTMDGGCKVRGLVFKYDPGRLPPGTPDMRIVMYYWQQNRDGSTDTAARMGTYRDMDSRLKTGWGAVALGHQTAIIRIYTYIAPFDKNGVQAQRNVDEISRAVWAAVRANGSASDTNGEAL